MNSARLGKCSQFGLLLEGSGNFWEYVAKEMETLAYYENP
jgi:hypothetical protein